MGLFGGDSSSTLTEIGATDYADVLSGKNSRLTESGAISLEKGAVLNTGLDLSGAKTGNIVFESGADDLRATFSETLDALRGLGEQSNAAVATAAESSSSLIQGVLQEVMGAVQGLAEGKQTEGESTMLKPILIFLGVSVVAIAALLWFTRK